jgi:hypothetical protein
VTPLSDRQGALGRLVERPDPDEPCELQDPMTVLA